jgi:hypothetical protein
LGAITKAKLDTFGIIGRKIEKCSISAGKNRRFGISGARVFCIRV